MSEIKIYGNWDFEDALSQALGTARLIGHSVSLTYNGYEMGIQPEDRLTALLERHKRLAHGN